MSECAVPAASDPGHEFLVRALLAREGLPADDAEIAMFVQAYRNVLEASRIVASAAHPNIDPLPVVSLEQFKFGGDDAG